MIVTVVGVSATACSDTAVEEVELSPTVDVSKGSIVSIITTVIGDAVTVLADSVLVIVTGVSVSVTVRPGCVIVVFAVLVAWTVMVVSGSSVVSDASGVEDVVFDVGEDT